MARIVRRRTLACAASTAMLAVACNGLDPGERVSEDTTRPLPSLDLLGETTVAYSRVYALALVDEAKACVIDSFAVVVQCYSRASSDVITVGAEGQGPGEYETPALLIGGSSEELAIIDFSLSRMTIYSSTGEFLSSIRIPFLFEPMGRLDATVVGAFTQTTDRPAQHRVARISIDAGEVLESRVFPHPMDLGLLPEGRRGLSYGALAPDGTLAFLSVGPSIVEYSALGELGTVMPASGYVPELPSPRDVAELRSSYEGSFFGSAPPGVIEEYSSEPKSYLISGRSMLFDDQGRLWMATQRDRDRRSFFDLYDAGAYLGSIRVVDRVLGFDIVGKRLAVLVERSTSNSEGLPARAIDWYAIEESEPGHP